MRWIAAIVRMARQSAIIKKLSSVEALCSASMICSDKTGTLTRSEMTIERVMTASGSSCISGTGYAPEGQVEHEGAALTGGPVHQEHVAVLSGGSLAGNAELRPEAGGEWRIEGDPTEAAFVVTQRKFGIAERRKRRFERLGEIPFTSEQKMMSTTECDHENGDAVLVLRVPRNSSWARAASWSCHCWQRRSWGSIWSLTPARRWRSASIHRAAM